MDKPLYFQNYHKHTSYSHRYNKDSPLVFKDYFNEYAKLSKDGVPQIYSTVEHGWQGSYFKVYNDLESFNKDNSKEEYIKKKNGEKVLNPYYSKNYNPIKFIFGTEAYWVKDRFESDSTNNHIVLLAKNDNGRKKINRAIYESYKTGYYYKNRMDLDILLSLPKDDVFVTSACIGFWTGYGQFEEELPFGGDMIPQDFSKVDEVILKLNNHFTDFYLEVQANNTDMQRQVNTHILELHNKYGIPIIAGTDSHVIVESQLADRDDLLKSNKISYPDEDGAYVDLPSVDVLIERFITQGVLSEDKIYEAIQNTNKILDFEDIILDRSLKVPVPKQYKNLSLEERNELFVNILRREWKEQINDINRDKFDQYISEIKHDIGEIIGCNMADYFLCNYEIMKLSQEKYGGILTPSGRGSGVSMYLNKLLKFTKVDKVNSPVLMYSERFLTKERILDSKTPPDIDHNVSEREPFIQAQRDVICEEGTFDLLALGTLHYKSAFKMYSRAYNLDPQLANDVSKQIEKYELAIKHAEEDEKDLIDIYDYVDKKDYEYLIEGCKQYMGIVDNVKSHPCFTKDELVMTNRGYKKISEINIGDKVLTIDHEFKCVTKTMVNKSDNIYNLTIFGSSPIEVTGNHPYFVSSRKYNTYCPKGHDRRELTEPRWVDVSQLKKGDLVGVAINKESILPKLDFVDSSNVDFWWCLGRYFGDGWRSHTVRKSGHRKGDKIKDVIICCNKNNNDTFDILERTKTWCETRVAEESTTNKIYLKCSGLYDWLEQFGDYAKNKHLTNDIFDLPVHLLKEFLNGYFSADGSFDKKEESQRFSTISKELGLGIVACINKAYNRPCSFRKNNENRTEIIQGRTVNCNEKYVGEFHYDDRPQDSAFYRDGYIWCPYRSKKLLCKSENVYNLEVEDNHTYTVNNLIVHNCGTVAYDGDAIEDIGVIMVKSESTGRECFVAVIESGIIDYFGYLKQDYLIVDSIGLTYEVYKEIGMNPMSVNKLLEAIENDELTWDIYKNGYTMCVNQCEQVKSTQKVMRFSPKNIAELTQFIAGIRPSFQSMYKKFESREHFEYGIKALDMLIQDAFCQSSFILYQEHLMKVLSFAHFEIGETYTIIKAISKKREALIKEAKEKFVPSFAEAIIATEETSDYNVALKLAEDVWKIVEDSASYGFNCVSGDTKIMRSSNNGSFSPTVEEMYRIKNDRDYAKRTKHLNLHDKYNRYGYGKGLSLKDGRLYENDITDIRIKDTRQTYTLTTRNGRTINCTDNHKFPTPNGEKPLSELKVGEFLYYKGKYKKKYFDTSLTNGFEPNHPKKGQCGFQHRIDGDSVVYESFRTEMVTNRCSCEECGLKYDDSIRFEVHHKDMDRKNNKKENFAWLCVPCHKKEHYKNGRTKRYENGIEIGLDEIISIEPRKVEIVYDVEMSGDISHTFVVDNGLVTSNSAHAFCMAIDSVTLAWQKAHYPLQFYKVALQWYTNKGNKDKVSSLKKEMLKRGITLNQIKFGEDNRKFSINKETNSINQTMSSIKDMQKIAPDILYELGHNKYQSLFFLFKDLLKTDLNKKSIDILIKLDYFREYGDINYILFQLQIYNDMAKIFDKLSTCKQLNKADCETLHFTVEEVSACCNKVTEKQFREFDNVKLLEVFRKHYQEILADVTSKYTYEPISEIEKMAHQAKLLGYVDIIDDTIHPDFYIVEDIEKNQYGTTFISIYHCCDGTSIPSIKIDRNWWNEYPCEVGDVLDCAFKTKEKKRPVEEEKNGKKKTKWIGTGEYEEILSCYSKLETN